MDKNKLDKAKKILELADSGVDRDQVIKSFKAALSVIVKLEVKLIKSIESRIGTEVARLQKMGQELKDLVQSTTTANKELLAKFEASILSKVEKLLGERLGALNSKIQEADDKLKQVKDGRAGIDADEGRVVGEVLKRIKDNKMEMGNVKGLEKELEDLRNIRTRVRGGGTSAMGIANAFKYLLHTEAPSGDIDGANKEYTVQHTIFAVLAFSLNGEVIPQLPNYTISGKKITFSTALPADYAGTDFEIKYI